MNANSQRSSAHSGFAEWLLQRVSAVYLVVFSLYMAASFLLAPWTSYAAWKGWFATGSVRLAWALAIASLLVHAWTGMRSVFLDYLKPVWLRFLAQALTATALLAMALWAANILLVVATPS